jgi:hypothetical protein
MPATVPVTAATSLRSSLVTSAADALPDGGPRPATSTPACADAHALQRTSPASWMPAALPPAPPHAVASVLAPLSNAVTQSLRVPALARAATWAAAESAQVAASAADAVFVALVHVKVLDAMSWSPIVD